MEDKIKEFKCKTEYIVKDCNEASRNIDQELQLCRDQLADKKVELMRNETHNKIELDTVKRNYESKLSTYVSKIDQIQQN